MSILKRIQYNSPVILTYAFLSLAALALGYATQGLTTSLLFSVYQGPMTDPLFYVRMFGHVLGHANFVHYFNNFILILMVGPVLEEKYGSWRLLVMMLVTALVTGLLNAFLFSGVALLGASGIVFMLILLSSFVNIQKGRIPLTLILVIVVFIGREAVDGLTATDNISHLTHIVGGCCGAALGFLMNRDKFSDKGTVEGTESDDIELP